ncbi:MAG TPA: 3-phosphoshikimate 1-carboxyvinyltransferase [Opitutaceae bacterium]|nr:3-phosphoshikimate 1-carboxyvinyltransferase [Opitutaceae bacterium]
MPLSDPYPVKPFTQPARGEVTLPGSKSITNRALLLAALCDGPVTLTGALFSEDTEIMAKALDALGFKIEPRPGKNEIYVEGRGGKIPNETAELFVGNAGTAARFLTALCAAAPRGTYKLDGVPQMRKRPMKGLIEALRSLGADIRCLDEEGYFPIEIHACGLTGGDVGIDASESSQMLSALLMVAPLAATQVEVTLIGDVRWPFVQMTTRLMESFGQPRFGSIGQSYFSIPCGAPYASPSSYAMEPDATAASYYAALPLVVAGKIALLHLRWGLQGDTDFLGIIALAGSTVEQTYDGFEISFEAGLPRKGIAKDFNKFSDTFLTLAAISPLLEGQTKITGIAHTRKQETDRVAGAARELKKLIGDDNVIEEEDSLTITPNPAELKKRAAKGVIEIETYNDHRFAMSFAILGCHDLLKNGKPWLSIRNPACCAKTFPNFFDVLEQVWKNSHQ